MRLMGSSSGLWIDIDDAARAPGIESSVFRCASLRAVLTLTNSVRSNREG